MIILQYAVYTFTLFLVSAWTSLLLQTLALPLWKAVPNVYSPNVAKRLRPMGSGFPDLMARGIELPARMMEASRANSTP